MSVFLAIPILIFDIGASDNGFVREGTGGQWAWGIPTSGPGGPDPVWATRLSAPYLNDAIDALEIPLPDRGTATSPTFAIEHWWSIAEGDGGFLQIHDPDGWTPLLPTGGYPTSTGFSGQSGGFRIGAFPLAAHPTADRVRLVFASDIAGNGPGWFVRGVGIWDGDVLPPVIEPLVVPDDTQDLIGPYLATFSVTDDVAVTSVSANIYFDGDFKTAVDAELLGGSEYRIEIPAAPPGTRVGVIVRASDGSQQSRWPESAASVFRVFLAEPLDLRLDEPRAVGPVVRVAWAAPDTDQPIVAYHLVDVDDGDEWVTTEMFVDVPVVRAGEHHWRVWAEYAGGLGDPSDILTAEVEIPALVDVVPAQVYPGDHVRISLTGRSLYMVDGETAADWGEGVTVDAVTVLDVDHAEVDLTVAVNAVPGTRDVSLSGPLGEVTFTDGFEIASLADRPSIVEVSPPSIVQGAVTEVVLQASEAFAGVPTVDAGAGIVVTSVSVDGIYTRVTFAVAGAAATGVRTLVIDDGQRLWTAPLTIDELYLPENRTCDTSSAGVSGWGGLIGLVGLFRRRANQRNRA